MMHIWGKDKQPLSFDTSDDYAYLNDLKKQLQISSDQKDAERHYGLAQRLNQEDFLRLAGKMIKGPKGLKLVKDLISSINYPLLYSTRKQFELAYFYKSIPNLCKVSIVVPVYNVEKYLSECLDSLINQSWENIEIICVNDASTDNSLQILEEYQKKDARISVYSYETNKGPSYARNFGITKCNSEFVVFVDSDDWLPKKAIKNMYQAIIIPGVDWVLGKAQAHGPNLLKKEKEKFFAKFHHKTGACTLPTNIGDFVYISPWGKLHKLSIILQNQLNFPVGVVNEDQSWIWEYGLCCHKVFYLNQPVYVYRMNSSSLTNDASAVSCFFQDLLSVHIFLYKRLSKRFGIEKYNLYLARYFVSKIQYWAEKNNFQINSKMYCLFKKYMRLNPEVKKWIFLSEKCFNKTVRFAQIDLINTENKGNSVSVTLAEGTSQKIDTPKGSGVTVRQIPHQSYFTAIIHGKGHLKVLLKSQNVGKGKPTSVLFKSLCVNGKNLLKGKKEVFSDKCLEFDLPVYDGAKLFFEINYNTTNGSYGMLKEGVDFFKLKIKDKAVLYIRSLTE